MYHVSNDKIRLHVEKQCIDR